jgi:hypothetical protein
MYRIIGADGNEYGPVTLEQLRAWMAEGRVNHDTRVKTEGSTEWKTLASLPEIVGTVAAAPPPLATQLPPRIPNHLAPAILVTLFCCLPFGIPAIVFAAQVNTKLAAGNVAGAMESSRKAKMWCWISVAGWALAFLGYAVFFGLLASRHGARHF